MLMPVDSRTQTQWGRSQVYDGWFDYPKPRLRPEKHWSLSWHRKWIHKEFMHIVAVGYCYKQSLDSSDQFVRDRFF